MLVEVVDTVRVKPVMLVEVVSRGEAHHVI
jgi:hypothetical protein